MSAADRTPNNATGRSSSCQSEHLPHNEVTRLSSLSHVRRLTSFAHFWDCRSPLFIDKSSPAADATGVGSVCSCLRSRHFSTTEASCDYLGIGRLFRRGAPRGFPIRDPLPAGPVSALQIVSPRRKVGSSSGPPCLREAQSLDAVLFMIGSANRLPAEHLGRVKQARCMR
jgi:hypothetical protein